MDRKCCLCPNPSYEKIYCVECTRMKNSKKGFDIAPDKYNKMTDRQKWTFCGNVNGSFRCPYCKHESNPSMCIPFPGAFKECSECDYILTRRTGGGQLDPFGWELFIRTQSHENYGNLQML